jgi:hypothetical protein
MEQFLNNPSSNELEEIRSHFSQSHTSSGLFEEFLLPFSISYKLGIVEEMRRFKRKMEKLGDSDTLFDCKCEEEELFQRGALELCYLACKI